MASGGGERGEQTPAERQRPVRRLRRLAQGCQGIPLCMLILYLLFSTNHCTYAEKPDDVLPYILTISRFS